MRLELDKKYSNYACRVVRIEKLMPIQNADRIQIAYHSGMSFIVNKSITQGSLMLCFLAGTQLSEDFCRINNLYENKEMNENPEEKGFISRKRRVKAIKLRGVISEGLLMPLNSLKTWVEDYTSLKEGDSFTHVNNFEVCTKYIIVPPSNSSKSKKGEKKMRSLPKESRLEKHYFHLHGNTSNLRYNSHKIKPDTYIGVHYKKHGTSVVIGNVPTKVPLTFGQKILKWLGVPIHSVAYDIIYSSRRVIKNGYYNSKNTEDYYSSDIWGIVANEVGHLIPKNWTLYGEILGYLPDGKYIQKGYDYGCKPGEHTFYVYKISITNEDGKVHYLSDLQIKEWCDSVGLNFSKTLLYYGLAKDMFPKMRATVNFGKYFLKYLEEAYTEADCWMCLNNVPQEGVVVRIDSGVSYEAYKLKSKRFILQESDLQEKGEVNIEDNQEGE